MNPITAWKSRRAKRRQNPPAHQSPFQRLIPHLVETAHAARAASILIGFRQDLPLADQLPTPLPDDHPELTLARARIAATCKRPPHEIAENRSTTLRGPHGSDHIPIWFEIDTQLHLHQFFPLHSYPYVLNVLEDNLVSLNAAPDTPQPTRYIEITATTTTRRFLEIDLEWSAQNLLHIHLRSLREVAPDTHVSTTSC